MAGLKITVGELIVCHNEIARVNACLSSDKIQVTFKNTKRQAVIGPEDIRYVLSQQTEHLEDLDPALDLAELSEEQLVLAQRRYDILAKHLGDNQTEKSSIEDIATELNLGIPRTYQLISRFVKYGDLGSLVNNAPGPKTGSRRLAEPIELIIQAAIDSANGPASTTKKIYGAVKRMCANAKLTPPSIKAVTARVQSQDPKERTKKQYGPKKARQDHDVRPHIFPATRALELVQLDHCRVDCEVVDEKYRSPIARPWLTLAIDVYTRVVLGFYLTLDSPSALSNAMCMIHAVLPKKMWLEKYKILNIDYPYYGLPRRIHVDNGKDFRSFAFIHGCSQYGIKLTWRPPATPHNGAHIERFFGTLMRKVRALPGATMSSVADKKKYSNIAAPAMTISELREWITEQIDIYHKEEHEGLGCSPLYQWEESFKDKQGRLTTPELVVDSERFFLDFLPIKSSSVQRSGVKANSIDYFSPALSAISIKTKCIVRYNPMSLAKIWVKPEGASDYIECTYSDVRHSDTTLAEFQHAKKELATKSNARVSAQEVFMALERNEQRVSDANQRTKKARLSEEKKKSRLNAFPTGSNPTPSKSVDYSQPPKIYDVE
ncbi:Mu transposase C-terminal domain-containing protein [Pseudomonas fluorescens]|uniref:Mu transposase C-terminal domain-containing protein n=1 Tax=Pseudomonas fluorescens TaxID=294 RepID=UPI00069ADD24|nr:Mu transposase C-terminal domain-containing protein [Pseudomonas fluorescens]